MPRKHRAVEKLRMQLPVGYEFGEGNHVVASEQDNVIIGQSLSPPTTSSRRTPGRRAVAFGHVASCLLNNERRWLWVPAQGRDDDGGRQLARRIGARHLHRTVEAVPIGFARVGSLICRPE